MKPLRLVSTPTRNRRLNEIIGLVVMVCAGLLLLALASYTPTDPSPDTVGGSIAPVAGAHLAARLAAHNWTGLIGAWWADVILQTIGIAAFFLPILLGRVGFCWIRQRAAGSAMTRGLGLVLWIIFAPAALGLLPRTFLWRHALPIEGVSGRLLADAMVHYLNLPGATIVLALMVALSLYLATTFTLHTAGEWIESHFSFVRRLHERIQDWRIRRAFAKAEKSGLKDQGEPMQAGAVFASKREQTLEQAANDLERERVERSASQNTLLGGLFNWFGRLRGKRAPAAVSADGDLDRPADAPVSVWQNMPRTNVDAPPATALSTAAAAAAPYAEALAAL
jgi:S-DNA-T family DNA segregation ATPase FtsK/SpoIIIE